MATKNKTAIVIGLLGLVTSFYIIPVLLNIVGLIMSIQVLKASKNKQGKLALSINAAGILLVVSILLFLSQLNFTNEEFGF